MTDPIFTFNRIPATSIDSKHNKDVFDAVARIDTIAFPVWEVRRGFATVDSLNECDRDGAYIA